ncbi:acetate/propionate family kinase [Oligella urethralis]|uniref:acetate/propionate family kinase n=1 Tax=Oligella urethralis TaxID=90245 RepID=UPI0003715B1E|nr:acetate/propionate family kinase [Oligella urethralis]SUA69283.1 Acetate kinase [Oligella urethralis]
MTVKKVKAKGFLALNSGSSSLKFALYLDEQEKESMVGRCEQIGTGGNVRIKDIEGQPLVLPKTYSLDTHEAAMQVVLDAMAYFFPDIEVQAVGHRVVHGGRSFDGPIFISPEVLENLERLVKLAPLHEPHNIAGIHAAMEAFPGVPQIACFDTAFHRSQSFVDNAFAIPYHYYEEGILRYGFHGLSYEYINAEVARLAPELHQGKVVVAHLGNGASLCAIEAGRSKASTMGFTAIDGLPMGTRCGQLDPGVILHFLETEGMSIKDLNRILYKESGLLGLSGGLSNDMRVLTEAGTEAAKRAIDYFTHKVCAGVASMAAAMQGIDLLVFTAGIGEHSSLVRRKVCEGLAWMGVSLDDISNTQGKGTRLISAKDSKFKVMVIPTDEEVIIVRAARALLAEKAVAEVC